MAWHCRLIILALFALCVLTFLLWQFYLQSLQVNNFVYERKGSSARAGPSAVLNKPLIVVWTRIFGEHSLMLGPDCPLHDQCSLTYDHGAINQADAVIYHIPDIKWVQPLNAVEIAYGEPQLPDLALFNEKRINVFLTQENPTTLANLYMLEALRNKARNYFHWVMSYLHSSHLPMPYGGFWIRPKDTLRLGFTPIHLPNDAKTILADKRVKGILWMVSNCNANSKRELAVQALSKFIPVTIGGKCAKTEEGRRLCPRDAPNGCVDLFRHYYFYIAAENDNCRDYVTEKYWDRYKLPAIPIVMRKSVHERILPNNSFIAMDQYSGPREMAADLQHLMDNPGAYLSYFQWRTQNWSIAPWNNAGFRIGQCGLCERLIRLKRGQEQWPRVIPDVVEWFEQENQCEGGDFAEKWSKMASS